MALDYYHRSLDIQVRVVGHDHVWSCNKAAGKEGGERAGKGERMRNFHRGLAHTLSNNLFLPTLFLPWRSATNINECLTMFKFVGGGELKLAGERQGLN